jgi:hypothetical protein
VLATKNKQLQAGASNASNCLKADASNKNKQLQATLPKQLPPATFPGDC